MRKTVLINVEATDLRVAILEDSTLVELFVEYFNSKSILGNVYKGVVEGIVPGLKAVFVNIGLQRNAFLHFSDVLSDYSLPQRGRPERLTGSGSKIEQARAAREEKAMAESEEEFMPPPFVPEDAGEAPSKNGKKAKKTPSHELHAGDSILVQVIKEPIKDKGPRITSFVSIPGRYLVMMPFSERQGGVSRKISDQDERRRLRDLLRSLDSDSGSYIIRTAGLDEDESSIREDCKALQTQWKSTKRKNLRAKAPSLVHNEQNILQRLVRDTLRNDIDEILIDSRDEMKKLIKTAEKTAPGMVDRIHMFESTRNIFDVFDVEQQFQKALRRKVWQKSGGMIVIDETEALTAIDVNSGKYVGEGDQDQVILKTNLEACRVISQQLRLRDIGGLIVIDFIDMTNRAHQAQVLKELRTSLRRDNAKFSMTGFSDFGLVELTRKRVRMSLAHTVTEPCPYCEGAGRILGQADIWKKIKYDLVHQLDRQDSVDSADITVHSQLRTYLEKEVVGDLKSIAHRYGIGLNILSNSDYHHEQFSIVKHMKSTTQATKTRPARKRGSAGEKSLESARTQHDNVTRG